MGTTSSQQTSDNTEGTVLPDSKTVVTVSDSSSTSLPKAPSKDDSGAVNSASTTTPSSIAEVEPRTSSASSDSVEKLAAIGVPSDDRNTEKLTANSNSLTESSTSSDIGPGGLDQAMQSASLEDDTELLTSACSRCGGDGGSVLRQLFCVMEHCQGKQAVENWTSRFNPLERGQELLSKFVEVARGPLKTQGWKYGRAVQLLVTMKKAARAQ